MHDLFGSPHMAWGLQDDTPWPPKPQLQSPKHAVGGHMVGDPANPFGITALVRYETSLNRRRPQMQSQLRVFQQS